MSAQPSALLPARGRSAASRGAGPPEYAPALPPTTARLSALAGAPDQISAAVLVPLFIAAGDQPHAVFTRRRADLRRHAGEISFPGGRRDPEDPDLRATALREAQEEIGLPPEEVSVLGELPPVSTFVTGYLIHPFVGLIPSGQRWRASPSEVDVVLELPLQALLEGRTRTRMERRGVSFETDAYIVGEHLIWGATARILDDLYERLGSILGQQRGDGLARLPHPSGDVGGIGTQND